MKNKKKLLGCKYCNGIIGVLTDNHRIGCNLEAIAMILRFRSYEKEADEIDKIAARLK